METIKQSVHASLATELEMSKSGELLRRGDLEGAAEVLKVFHTQESKIAGAAANNLCMLKLLVSCSYWNLMSLNPWPSYVFSSN